MKDDEDGMDSVPKHRHIKFRRRKITQKKAYNRLIYLIIYLLLLLRSPITFLCRTYVNVYTNFVYIIFLS
jgi:hypothetical protein